MDVFANNAMWQKAFHMAELMHQHSVFPGTKWKELELETGKRNDMAMIRFYDGFQAEIFWDLLNMDEYDSDLPRSNSHKWRFIGIPF